MSHVRMITVVRFAFLFSCAVAGLAAQLPVVTHRTGPLNSQTLELRGLDTEHSYSLLFSVRSPRAFAAGARLMVRLTQGSSAIVSKTLHLGDPDFYTMFHAVRNGAAQ